VNAYDNEDNIEFEQSIGIYQKGMFHDKQYIQLCKSGDIFPQKGKNFYFDEDVQIAVFRDNHQLFAVSNICPHQYAAVICNGFLEEKTVTCPLHGWIYSLESGKALGSNARLLTYHIFEDEGLVWLEQPKKTRPLWLENF
jgi:nitrite reductase/ring-hydroxylating ferredoxin subunit